MTPDSQGKEQVARIYTWQAKGEGSYDGAKGEGSYDGTKGEWRA